MTVNNKAVKGCMVVPAFYALLPLSFRERYLAETRLPRYKGRLLAGVRPEHPLKKVKIVHLAHVLRFSWLHNTAVEPQPAGESGRERRTENMSAEENKAVVRREMEELFNHTGNLD